MLLRPARAVPIIVGRGSFGPNGLRLVEGSIGVFQAAGFSETDAADAYFSISNYVTGFCTFETAGADPGLMMDRKTMAQMARQYVGSLPPEQYPNLVAAAPRLFGGSRDERFAFGVDCLIAGFEAKLKATQAAARSDQDRSSNQDPSSKSGEPE